jgi:hypothetical protein
MSLHRPDSSKCQPTKSLRFEHLESRQLLATTSIGSGSWHDPAKWSDGVPTANDEAIISSGTTILLDGATQSARTLRIDGVLQVVENEVVSKSLSADWILVDGGTFQAGSVADPYDGNTLAITLEGDQPDQNLPALGISGNDAFLMTRNGGILALHGAAETSWTQLGASAVAGASSIVLKEPVTWNVGDEIVIASTTFDMNQAETRRISTVSSDGRRLGLDAPLQYGHFGKLQSYDNGQGTVYELDERAEVGLLSRNIKIQGDAEAAVDGVGGHLMFMPGSGSIQIDGVELYHLGQRGRLARYPVHWHLAGNREGDFLRNTSIHRSFNRAVTIHATHNVLVEQTVAYDHIGHGYFLENAVETGNKLYYNLGLVTREPAPGEELLPTDLGPKQFQISGPGTYWITNPDNELIGNVAGGSQSGSGFWYALPTGPLNQSRNDPQYAAVRPQQTPLGVFADNRAHSNFIGLDLDGGPNVNTDVAQSAHYAPPRMADFTRFTAFANQRNGVYYRGTGNIQLTDSRLADNHLDIMFAFNQTIRDSLLVGQSANSFGGAQRHAFAVYDGPTHLDNVHFAGFNVPGADLFEVIGAANRNTNHSFQNVTFDQPTPFTFDPTAANNTLSRHWGFALYDVDGSLTGSAGHAVVYDHPMMRTFDDTVPPGWQHAALSPHRFGHLRLLHGLGVGSNPTVQFRRSGGPGNVAGHTDVPNLDPFNQVGVVLNTDFEYEITYASPPTSEKIDVSLTDTVDGGYVYLRINNPWDWFTIQNATAFATDEQVRSSSGSAYHIDALGNVFLKVVVPDQSTATTIHLTRSVAPTPWIELLPTQDAYLEGSTPHNNQYLKLMATAEGQQTSYLMFNVTGLADRAVQRGTLQLKVAGNPGAGAIRLLRGDSTNWTEQNLSPANAPNPAGVMAAISGQFDVGDIVQFDVTDAITSEGALSLILKLGFGGDDVWFSATQGDEAPRLILDFSPPEPTGDFDANQRVDGSDLLAWQRGFGATTGVNLAHGDGDHNGIIDATDLALWEAEFSTVTSGEAAQTLLVAAGQAGQHTPPIPIVSDRWVAVDGLGRQLPGYDEVGPVRPDKYVGMFYFLWHGAHNANAVYDITQMIAANPGDPQYGPQGAFHWWGEPEEGYFRAEDPWVIKRNLRMLADIGVDVLFFDVTNAFTYLDTAIKVMRIARDMRLTGDPTPSFAFLTNSNAASTITSLYDNLYLPGILSEVWFHWQGKPLILGDIAAPGLSREIKAFFSWRYSWAWTDAANQPRHWQWIDEYPQDYGWDAYPSIPEEIPVAVASHPTNGRGSSYANGSEPPRDQFQLTRFTGVGRHFDEQWERAHEVDPDFVFVTGFNEWVAQRFIKQPGSGATQFLGQPLATGDTYFVDLYNQEYMRDVAPMKGGHTDNYYYQLAAEIRRFKGVRPPEPTFAASNISIDGSFDEWQSIGPVYTDVAGDTFHRDWPRYDLAVNYVNDTGRNDIVQSRASVDGSRLNFFAETASALTPWSDPQWMLLLLNTDRNQQTGWEGYDFAVNLEVLSETQTTLSAWSNGQWAPVDTIDFRADGNMLELAIPRTSLGLTGATVDLDFHWADNVGPLTDVSAFFVNGDSAPNRRFDYRYSAAVRFRTAPAADFDNNSLVDGQDFVVWQRGFGIALAATRQQGDANADGAVDTEDFNSWKQQFGLFSTVTVSAAAPDQATIVRHATLRRTALRLPPTTHGHPQVSLDAAFSLLAERNVSGGFES